MVVPELVNCSEAISCPGLAEPRITRTLTDVQVERGGPADADVCGAVEVARGELTGLDGATVDGAVVGADDDAGLRDGDGDAGVRRRMSAAGRAGGGHGRDQRERRDEPCARPAPARHQSIRRSVE